MLTIEDFVKPEDHPVEMLSDIPHAHEKESFLQWFLAECIKADDIDAEIDTTCNEDYMDVDYGLLTKVGKQKYKLTRKAKALLYIYYGTGD